MEAEFRIEDSDKDVLEKRFGKGVLNSDVIKLSRQYDGTPLLSYSVNEDVEIEAVIRDVTLPTGDRPANRADLNAVLAKLKERAAEPEAIAVASNLQSTLPQKAQEFEQALRGAVFELIPNFFYHADYSRLPGTVKIRELLKADPKSLDENAHTALALLKLAAPTMTTF